VRSPQPRTPLDKPPCFRYNLTVMRNAPSPTLTTALLLSLSLTGALRAEPFLVDSLYGHVYKIDSPDLQNPLPIANAKVTLMDESNVKLDSTFTNSSGNYAFSNLTGVENEEKAIPRQNFHVWITSVSSSPVVNYVLPKKENVDIDVYNVVGQKEKDLETRLQDAGSHSERLTGLSNGVHFVRIKAGNSEGTLRAVVLKNGNYSAAGFNTGVVVEEEKKPKLFSNPSVAAYGPFKIKFERADSFIQATPDSVSWTTGSKEFNAALLPRTYRIPSGATVTINPAEMDSLYRIYGQPYNQKLWWQWPVPTFLSNCNHQDSLDVMNAIGPLDTLQTPADSSVAGKTGMKYIYGVTDSATYWNNGVLLIIKKDVGNSTGMYGDDPAHPGYLGKVVSRTNMATHSLIQHEAAGWGMGKGLVSTSLFNSNMNPTGMTEYTAPDVAYTILMENDKELKKNGKQNIRFYYQGK